MAEACDAKFVMGNSLSALSILLYFVCSSTMLVLNKAALNRLPFPVIVTTFQTISTALLISCLRLAGVVKYPPMSASKVKAWRGVALIFSVVLLCNMGAMRHVGVESMVMFRSSTTILVAICDLVILGTKISLRQFVACCLIFSGGAVFALHDVTTRAVGWMWGVLYAGSMVLNTIFVKHVFNQQAEIGVWEKTFLTNFMSSPLLLLLTIQEDRAEAIRRLQEFSHVDFFVLILSCLGGFGISVSGTVCRQALTATGFDVLGNSTKYATLGFNALALGSSVTSQAMFGVIIALTGGVLYSPTSCAICI
eukprot:Tamp_05505.p1 GENE.Tamp_05505~~Tamp_05505.p1  ORF type:complete len:339 (-),score=13.27 Tamp_05505:1936-2859(-)